MPRDRVATYRLQFREGMDFAHAAELVPYLTRLGVSHLYASPIFTAASGSTHGYDVANYNECDPALGGREGFEVLSRALREAGIGLMLDIVPNHMAASPENPWWRDVTEWGPRALHANHFDIDWSRRLTLPILGREFDEAVAEGEIRIRADDDRRGLVLSYYDTAYPLTPPSYAVLARADPDCASLSEVAEAAERAAPDSAADFHAAMQARLPDEGLDACLARLSNEATVMRRLHDAQPWLLTDWREARRSLSYRRFFEVTGLVGTRVEDAPVFDDVHRLTLDLVREGHVDALRIDHVDGLSDPGAYLARLREAAGPDVWIVVEKILEHGEVLPSAWPVEGTTGYEFIAAMSDLFHPRDGAAVLEAAYSGVTGAPPPAQRRDAAKRLMVTQNFEGELTRLVDLLMREVEGQDENLLREALIAIIVALPVYRTYGDPTGFAGADRELLSAVSAVAAEAAGAAPVEAVRDALSEPGAWELRARFQQLTGPAMAKAVEDTLFYRHTALLAKNEVGCDPVVPPGRSADVHGVLAVRGRREPFGINTTSTHDTKRGEDARARLYTLATRPSDWIAAVERWRGWAAGAAAPEIEPSLEWTIYQALAGIWPDDGVPDAATLGSLRERFHEFLVKALREAKLQTSWTDEDAAYEAAATGYAAALLDPGNPRFLRDFTETLRPFVEAGQVTSLAQTLVKLTAPGIPDIYQGSEVGDHSMVDPDNRRPPDFGALSRMLDGQGGTPDGFAARKMALIARTLAERRRRPDLYVHGQYEPLAVDGPMAGSVFGYLREEGESRAAVVVPIRGRLPDAESRQDWEQTQVALPRGTWQSVLGESEVEGGPVPLPALLAAFPVALLVGGLRPASPKA